MNKFSKQPYISVVIPALNEADYLPRALGSLNAQTFRDFEIIVADNGSTDATAQIALSHGARVISETKPGVCAARDAGTRAARGQIIVSTDADTVFQPDWLNKIAAQFADPTVILVAGPPRFIQAPLWGQIYSRGLFGAIGLWQKLTGGLPYISAANLAFRRQLWNGYNTKLTQGGDELYVLRKLRGQGEFRWLAANPVDTSSRRMKKGLLYNVVVTFFGYYASDYIISKLTNRSLFGSYPAIRDQKSQRATGWKTASFAIVMLGLVYSVESHPAMAEAIARRSPRVPGIHAIAQRFDRDGHKL